MKSDVVRGMIDYRFDFVESFEGENVTAASGKRILKFADSGVGWRIGAIQRERLPDL